MLNPPSGTTKEAFIAAIRSGSPVHMRFTQPGHTTITDADFHENGLIFRDILNSDTDLTIGKSVKKEIAFKLIGVSPSINFNAEFTAEIGVEINGSTVWVTLGKFTAVYPDNYVDEYVSEYVAYDRMSLFDVPADEWLKSLTYPMTVQQMFESLCSYVGLTGEIGNALSNMKSRSFSSAPIQNLGLMCRDVLELIAEACGCYAVITNEGNCKLKWYSIASYTEGGSNVVYTVSGDEIFDRKQKNYMTMVSGLNVKQAEDDVGVLYPSTATSDIYVIVDNPFLVTADSTEEDNYIVPLYNRLRNGNVMHYPIEVTCVGNPLIEAGDIIYANTNGSTTMWFPIYVKEMHWNGSLTDVYYSTGSIHRQSYTSAIKQKLSQGGRYHIFKNTVDQLYSELYDPTTGDISVLDQRASALELSVADKYSIVSGIGITSAGVEVTGSKYVKIISGGSFLVEATNFKIDSANKYMKTGNWTFDDNGLTYNDDSASLFKLTPNQAQMTRPSNNFDCSFIQPFGDSIGFYVWDHADNAPVNPVSIHKDGIYLSSVPDANIYNVKRLHTNEIESYAYLDVYNTNNGYGIRVNGQQVKSILTPDEILFNGTKSLTSVIRFWNNAVDSYGNGVVIGANGCVIIGAGESSDEVKNFSGATAGSETLYLASDNDIKLLTNVNSGYSSRKEFTAGSDGSFVAPGRLYQNGNQAVPLTDTWRGYQIKNYDVQYTVGANTFKDITANDFGVSTPAGYTPVAITMFNPGNDKCWAAAMKADATGTTPMMTVHNPTNGSFTNHAYIAVLYLQTGSP